MKRKTLGHGLLAAFLAASTAISALPVQAAEFTSALSQADMQLVTASSSQVAFSTASGAEEVAYAEWGAVTGASGYNVYVKAQGGSYTQIDTTLVRQYADCFRADVPGLAAGSYTLKVVPVVDGKEDTAKAAETAALQVTAMDRSGFSYQNSSKDIGSGVYGCGGYQKDGTLASNAQVLYVTADTVNTIKLDVITNSKGATTACTGLADILAKRQKGYDLTPLVIRVVGEVKKADVSGLNGSGYLQVKGCTNVTLEGVGEDATINGWGLLVRSATNIEIKNLAVMLFPDDGVSLDTDNTNITVSHCDIMYGTAGGDADQAKGDGSADVKGDSKYVTFSYNHFWDSGKCSLCGMTSETGENWITYHHNWFDHSDSRHPRIRTMSVHVYNNYYDGNAKYGVGATSGSSAFVENNYFRNCKYPMLASLQGTDADGEGTFSGEAGGMIKSYGNVIEGAKALITQNDGNAKNDIDCYEASSRDEQVPSDYTTLSGGTTYNNFDTNSSIMYSYTPDAAADVPNIVTAEAGRLNGGDFQFDFDDATDDESYSINQTLMAQVKAYTSPVVAIGSGFTDDTDPITTTTTSDTLAPTTTTTTVSVSATQSAAATTTKAPITTTTEQKPDVVTDGDIFCAPKGTGSGKTQDDPASVTDAIKNLTAGHTIYLLGGTYELSEMIMITAENSGTASAMKTIKPYNQADVVFDFSGQGAANGSNRGIVLNGDYWHFYGFEITKAADNGMLLAGNNNTIERMIFNDNQDTGLQVSRYDSSASAIADWPTDNLILNCTAKNNCDDATMENADGFAAKLTCGEGNVFDGCMSYNNSDDGWDLYAKEETGPIGVVTIQNCVAFRNGYTEFGEGYGDCDGNGFKLGGAGVGSPHVVVNCLAFENLNTGFTDNNNPKLESLTNCSSYNNGIGGSGKSNYMVYRCTDDGCDFSNIISYYNTDRIKSALAPGVSSAKIGNDKLVGTIQNSVFYNGKYYQAGSKINITSGMKLSNDEVVTLTDDDFVSLDAPKMGEDFDTLWRNADGSITTNGYMQVKDSSAFYAVQGAVFSDVEEPPVVTTETTTATTETTIASTETTTVSSTTEASKETSTTESTESTVASSSDLVTETEPITTSASSVSTDASTTATATSNSTETTTKSEEPVPTDVLYGDVNMDSKIDLTDAILLNKAVAGAVNLNTVQFANADCFHDGGMNADDSLSLLRFLVHVVSALPVTE